MIKIDLIFFLIFIYRDVLDLCIRNLECTEFVGGVPVYLPGREPFDGTEE